MLYTIRTSAICLLSSIVCFPTPVRRSYLRAYKAPFCADFCAFCADFCAFCASLRLKRTVFTRLKIKVRPKGLHSFDFSILIFDFSFQLLIPNPQSLIPRPSPLYAIHNTRYESNPRLINDLRSTKVYVRKNNLFMQNKANFRKVKLNVNEVLTKDYVQMDTWSIRTTKPIQSQLKPIQSQSKPIKCQNKANQSQFKANLSCRSLWRSRNKPNFKRGKIQWFAKLLLGGYNNCRIKGKLLC